MSDLPTPDPTATPSTSPQEPRRWLISWPYRAVAALVLVALAWIATDVLLGLADSDDPTGDVVVLGCVATMGSLAAWPTMRPRAHLDSQRLSVRNALSTWEVPLARIATARVNEHGAVEVVDEQGRARHVAVAAPDLLDRLTRIDQRRELLDALAGHGVPVEWPVDQPDDQPDDQA